MGKGYLLLFTTKYNHLPPILPPKNKGSKRIVWNLLEYNNGPMLVIAKDLEDFMGQYGIVWNSGVVEVAGVEPKSVVEPS